MQDINCVALTAHLTRDPDLRSLSSGVSVCRLRIASNTRHKVSGEWEDKANYFDVVVWAARADAAARCLKKGSRIALAGHLEHREYEAEDGSKRQVVEIVADDVVFLSTPES